MRAIIIGAGRGSRLMPTTADTPKCFAEVNGKRMIDWAVESFQANGIDDIVFIGGYQIDKVREAYPQFTFRHNDAWESNNILASLFYAEDKMDVPFICSYSDILFSPEIIAGLKQSTAPITLAVDTNWLGRYGERTEHPSDDAEKVTAQNGSITRIERTIPEQEAHGEYTGIASFNHEGAKTLREHFRHCRETFGNGVFREGRHFQKAYFIQLLQHMIEQGVSMAHFDSPGGYIEVDTQQDFEFARQNWPNGV